MNIISALTMTSIEIAELVEKRHDNVKRTIETLSSQGVIRLPQIEESEKINNLGLPQRVKVYMFTGDQGKRDSIIVVAQLSPEFTARLVDRWQELEAKSSPKTMAEIVLYNAQKLVDQERAIAALEHRLDQIETASEYYTIIGWEAKRTGKRHSITLSEASKLGRIATTYCKEHDIKLGEVPDPRFGSVKAYPKWVLDDLFGDRT